jgi:hypothetical protein
MNAAISTPRYNRYCPDTLARSWWALSLFLTSVFCLTPKQLGEPLARGSIKYGMTTWSLASSSRNLEV